MRQFLSGIPLFRRGFELAQHIAQPAHGEGQSKKLRFGKAGDEGKKKNQPAGHLQRFGLSKELPAYLSAHVHIGIAGTGDENARRNGDNQRGNLGNKTIPDGQNAINLERFSGGNAVLGDADDRAAHNVDHGHDHPGDAVAFDELHGPVHGPEHLAFLTDGVAPLLSFLHIDDPGAHIRVDGHLFAGHGVQGEARAHFGHTFRAFGDDQKLYNGENKEDHRAHHEVAAQGELPEGLNDLPGVGVEQNQAGGGDVQAHAKQRGKQQHGRKRGKFQRRLDVHRHHHDGERERQVRSYERIDQSRGQGHDHQGDDRHQQSHQPQVAVSGGGVYNAARVGKKAHRRPPPAASHAFTAFLASSARPVSHKARALSR